jgi:hypothetical protein
VPTAATTTTIAGISCCCARLVLLGVLLVVLLQRGLHGMTCSCRMLRAVLFLRHGAGAADSQAPLAANGRVVAAHLIHLPQPQQSANTQWTRCRG